MSKIFTKTKLYILILVVTMLFTTFSVIGIKNTSVSAEVNSVNIPYYNQLTTKLSKNFYCALETMAKDGILAKSGQFDLLANNVIVENDIKNFQNGNSTLLKEFGAGKDAFYLDHPDVFYVDFDKITLNLATDKNKYTASIGAGRNNNYYIDNGFNNETDILNAIENLNNKINSIINKITGVTIQEKIKQINTVIGTINYDFCDNETLKANSPYIRTSYALLTGYGVCEAYSKSFKLVCDKVGIDCAEVVGYYLNFDETTKQETKNPHAWNEVSLDGKWYLVDCTMNNTDITFAMYGQATAEKKYLNERTISYSGKVFTYPKLAEYDYDNEPITTRILENGDISISFNGKDANELISETPNLYLIAQHGNFTNNDIKWIDNGYYAIYNITTNNGGESIFTVLNNWELIRFFVTSQAPDNGYFYATFDTSKLVASSDAIVNPSYDKNTNRPIIRSLTPTNGTYLNATKTYNVTIEYDMQLELTGELGIRVYSPKYVDLGKYTTISNITFDGNKTISFTVSPSKMYMHNNVTYYFQPLNIYADENGTSPDYATLTFSMPSYVCDKIYNDGRLYMNVYGHPTLIDNNDLSMQNWQKQNGEYVTQKERSQLALVVSKTDSEDEKAMINNITSQTNISESSIKSFATYEIGLNVCGSVTTIPEGSYLKVAFGFPNGLTAKTGGVVYKLYHFKRDASGRIDPSITEEIPCTLTEYGIIAIVNSFSPFMLVGVDAINVTSPNKNVYIRNINPCGDFSAKIGARIQNEVLEINNDETLSITITPNKNYTIDYVLVNKKPIEVFDNTLNLTYSDLQNNSTIEIGYVALDIKSNELKNGIANLNSQFVARYSPTLEQEINNTAAKTLVTLFVGTIILLIGFIILYSFLSKKSFQKSKTTKQ